MATLQITPLATTYAQPAALDNLDSDIIQQEVAFQYARLQA